MREGDLHHLQPSISEVNGDHSYFRYSQFTKRLNQYGQFQNREEIRGMIVQTYFYMQDKCNINLSDAQSKLMTTWDKTYSSDEWECERNKQIEQIQGNDNSFINKKYEILFH